MRARQHVIITRNGCPVFVRYPVNVLLQANDHGIISNLPDKSDKVAGFKSSTWKYRTRSTLGVDSLQQSETMLRNHNEAAARTAQRLSKDVENAGRLRVGCAYAKSAFPDPHVSDLAALWPKNVTPPRTGLLLHAGTRYFWAVKHRRLGVQPPALFVAPPPKTPRPAKGKQCARALPRVEEIIPAGIREADYVRDDEDIDMSLFWDTVNPDPIDPNGCPGPSSHPDTTASSSSGNGLMRIQEPVFMGFPLSQLCLPNTFNVSNLQADAQLMLSFFEHHPEASKTNFFVCLPWYHAQGVQALPGQVVKIQGEHIGELEEGGVAV
ncbi:hypothetical protein C8F04DRAFT_1233776 [Mycena alexandri]|uniref:Uncharacterized protein n=1 Tax=Mycena alexandri TaxID=1745969 RepID=A0AAD6T0Y7_9AGAR|nr:hypothetical protein C8F04DRAFT_1233776 [Mycena alexandri]